MQAPPAGTHKQSGQEFAIKIMSVTPKGAVVGSNDNTWKDIEAEVAILCQLEHPNVVELKEFFFDQHSVFLVTNLISGATPCLGNDQDIAQHWRLFGSLISSSA